MNWPAIIFTVVGLGMILALELTVGRNARGGSYIAPPPALPPPPPPRK